MKEETLNAIRALSNIEWFLRATSSNSWISEKIWEQVDIVFDYLKKDNS